MGWLQRASANSQAGFWQAARLHPGERPGNYAHLAIAFDSGDEPVTAYVTDQRLICVSPTGGRIEAPLVEITGWLQSEARPGQVGIVLALPDPEAGEPAPLLLFPQKPRSRANVTLAVQFFRSLFAELQRVHPEASA